MSSDKITYYSDPEVLYDRNVDYVKGGSLSGFEVDKNFNTLEGRSIEKIELSSDSLEITLLNGKVISCPLAGIAAVRFLSFSYDRENGKLKVYVNSDEEPIEVGGFVSDRDIRHLLDMGVLTDGTIVGNGSLRNPLSLAHIYRTGMFKSVIAHVEELPETDLRAGDRYVTTEVVDRCGALYNYKGVLNIIENLKGTEWHVATKHDWDDMLNALEPELADRNHHVHECNVFLGESANHYLCTDNRGFDAVLCGYAYEEEELHVVYNGQRAGWWTATHDDDKNAYIKRIYSGYDGVYQDIDDGKHYYSVRLVRNIKPNEIIGAETIMGSLYNTSIMPSMSMGLRLWTSTNFTSDLVPETEEVSETTTETDCEGVTTTTTVTTTEVVDDMSDAIYRPLEYAEKVTFSYINEWNGSRWIKQKIDEYDAFYVTSLGGFYYMSGNQLVSVNDATPIDLTDRVAALETRADATDQTFVEYDERMTAIEDVVDSHTTEIGSIVDELNTLSTKTDEAYNMALTAAGQSTMAISKVDDYIEIINSLMNDVNRLKQIHGVDFVEAYLMDASRYRYGDGYAYFGLIACDSLTVKYSVESENFGYEGENVSSDIGRYLGALYYTNSVDNIKYDGTGYTWNEDRPTTIGNYESSGTKLTDAIMNDYSANRESDGSWNFEIFINGIPVEFYISIR